MDVTFVPSLSKSCIRPVTSYARLNRSDSGVLFVCGHYYIDLLGHSMAG